MMAVFNSSSSTQNCVLQYSLIFITGMIVKSASFGDLMKTGHGKTFYIC
jgi:hypothetical protein